MDIVVRQGVSVSVRLEKHLRLSLIILESVWSQSCLVHRCDRIIRLWLNQHAILTVFDHLLHLIETICVVLQHIEEFLHTDIHLSILLVEVSRVLILHFLESVHLVDKRIDLVVPLALLHRHQIVEVLDQTSFECLLDLLTLDYGVVDLIDL